MLVTNCAPPKLCFLPLFLTSIFSIFFEHSFIIFIKSLFSPSLLGEAYIYLLGEPSFEFEACFRAFLFDLSYEREIS